MGTVGGALFQSIKGFRNAPSVSHLSVLIFSEKEGHQYNIFLISLCG